MKTKLSHSAASKYQLCGKSYDYHYNQKIRSQFQSAALCFGSALDNALNCILTNEGDAEKNFLSVFRFQKINNMNTYLPSCVNLVYADTDFDYELLTQTDIEFMSDQVSSGKIKMVGLDYKDYYDILRAKKKETGYANLSLDEKVFYNNMNWLSLKNKGLLMLKAYRKKVMPRIEKVYAVQKYVSLKNDEGDSVIGYVDLIADVKGIGTVILDNKTSAMEYEDDSVITSPQLSLYVHMLEAEYNTRTAGFIVLRKQVIKNRKKTCTACGHDGSGGRHKSCDATIDGKRCGGEWKEDIDPDIAIQFITDTIPPKTEQIVIENLDDINTAIKTGHFTRNLNSCHNTFGGPCPYLGLCFRDSMAGLEKV